MGGAGPLSHTTAPRISSPSPCQPPRQHFRWFSKNLTNPTHHRRGCRGFCRGQRGAVLETYCRKLAARLQLLVPTGGKVYKSLIKKKKSPPILFLLSPLPKDCETERAAGAWIRSIAEFLQSLGSLPPATAALGVWKKGGKKNKKKKRSKKKI